MELTNPIEEARRYVANAEEIIKKSVYDPATKLYIDNIIIGIWLPQHGALVKIGFGEIVLSPTGRNPNC